MPALLRTFLLVLPALWLCACAEGLTAANSTGYQFDPQFPVLLAPNGTLDKAKLNVVVLKPALRHVDILGGFGIRQPEAEQAEMEGVNYAAFASAMGLPYAASAKCGFAIDHKSLLDQAHTDKPLLDVGLATSAELFLSSPVKLSDAIAKPILLNLDPSTIACLRGQGRYVLLLRHDEMSEIDYLNRKPDGAWDSYKQAVVRNALRGSRPANQWNVTNFVILDTTDNRVMSHGDSWNLADDASGQASAWGPGMRKGLEKTLADLPQDYAKAKAAR